MAADQEMIDILTNVFKELKKISEQLDPKSSPNSSPWVNEGEFLRGVAEGFDSGIESLKDTDRVKLIAFYNKVKVLVTEFATLLPSDFSMKTKKLMDKTFEGAWDSTNIWNGNTIGGYHTYVSGKISSYEANKKEFTCEDLALSLLIDYASTHSLPVTIKNETGTYNSRTYTGDVEAFKIEVLSTTGANDLMHTTVSLDKYDTEGIRDFSDVKAGDLNLMYDGGGDHQPDDDIISHTQVIVGKKGEVIELKQGNIWFGSGKVDHPLYGGMEIAEVSYDTSADTYYNPSRKPTNNAYNSFAYNFRRWDFENF